LTGSPSPDACPFDVVVAGGGSAGVAAACAAAETGAHTALTAQMLPDTRGEHDGVTHHEHLDTGVPGTLECGDARGVAGMLTPTALLAVASVMWQAWLP
jgi:2-polyprenyl-6-methoxyphenol hydroxylase-like FAD-dependent oxidoreductase